MIWRYALPGPRTIQLRAGSMYVNGKARRDCIATVPSPPIISALLLVCREAAAEVVYRYQVLLVPSVFPTVKAFRPHYFDPSKDGIFVDDIWPWVGCTKKPVGVFNTRQLSIGCNAWWLAWNNWGGVSSNWLFDYGLLLFRHLEELTIVFRIPDDPVVDFNPRRLPPFDEGPDDIGYPMAGVDIRKDAIVERLQLMKTADPEWKVPIVKFVAWGKCPKGQVKHLRGMATRV